MFEGCASIAVKKGGYFEYQVHRCQVETSFSNNRFDYILLKFAIFIEYRFLSKTGRELDTDIAFDTEWLL